MTRISEVTVMFEKGTTLTSALKTTVKVASRLKRRVTCGFNGIEIPVEKDYSLDKLKELYQKKIVKKYQEE